MTGEGSIHVFQVVLIVEVVLGSVECLLDLLIFLKLRIASLVTAFLQKQTA